MEIEERHRAGAQLPAGAIEQAGAERLRHAGAAVAHPGVPAADQEASGATVERVPDQLADAAARGPPRVTAGPGDEAKPGGGGDLEHSRAPLVATEDPDGGLDGVAHGTADADGVEPAARGGDHALGEALAAVDEGQRVELGVGQRPTETLGDVVGDLERAEALLEPGGGDEDAEGHGGGPFGVCGGLWW